jgi:Transposase
MLKGEETLNSESKSKLDLLFENNTLLQKTYLLKEWLRNLWKFSNKKECNYFLNIWLAEASLLDNSHLNRICKTLKKYREMMLN